MKGLVTNTIIGTIDIGMSSDGSSKINFESRLRSWQFSRTGKVG